MVISESSGYSTLGTAYGRSSSVPARQAVTLEAKVNPDAPHEYTVHVAPDIEVVNEKQDEPTFAQQKSRQNQDPVSQAFFGVADFKAVKHKVDVFI